MEFTSKHFMEIVLTEVLVALNLTIIFFYYINVY